MLLFGCLLAFGAAFAPRLILILAWIFGRRWDLVWQGNIILPILGIVFLPYTTIMYMLSWGVGGISGFDWVWIFLGVMLDVMKWGQIAANRRGIPGQGSTTSEGYTSGVTPPPPAQPAAPAEVADEGSAQSELDKLADLRDQGVLTEEEYQAKKDQLEG